MDTFYRKNDLGVNIEYTVIGYYKKGSSNYMIYTDFTTSSNAFGINIYVDKEQNGKYIRISDEEQTQIINEYNSELIEYKANNG